MKKKISNRTITYFIYSLLLFLVVGIWFSETLKFIEVMELTIPGENRWSKGNIIFTLKLTNLYTASLISLFLGIGLFLKNKVGWILVVSWFYFVLSNFFKSIIQDRIDGFTDVLALIFLLSIPSAIIYVMNKFKGIENYHQIEGKNKWKLNLWALGIGLLLALFRVYKKNLLQHWL